MFLDVDNYYKNLDEQLDRLKKLEESVKYIQSYLSSLDEIEVKYKLEEGGKDPTKAHEEDAATDLYSLEDVTLEFAEPKLVKLSTALEMPSGHHGLIWDRSSMGKNGIHILGGLIDSGYRDTLAAILVNIKKDSTYNITQGQKITQILFIKLPKVRTVKTDTLSSSERGVRGFGSSGT